MEFEDMRLAVLPYLNKLAAFENEREIADFLIQEGVKAVPGHGTSCAIAEYVSRGSGQRVWVSRVGTDLVECKPDPYPVSSHTQAMRRFIAKFDRNGYPELEAK